MRMCSGLKQDKRSRILFALIENPCKMACFAGGGLEK